MKRRLRRFRLNENPKSTEYTKKLNEMIDAVNKANNLSLNVQGARGTVISNPNGNTLNVVFPKKSTFNMGGGVNDGVGGKTVRRAICTEDAPSGNVIIAYLYNSDGEEIEETIDVLCNISNGRIAQVDHATPANIEIGDIFRLYVELDAGGTDYAEFVATDTTVTNVAYGLASAWNAEAGAEFARVTAQGTSQYCRLTADTDGESFTVTGTATNGGATDDQTLTVATQTNNNATGDLDQATPRLKNGDDMIITKSNYYIDSDDPSIGFETQTKWVCVSNFAATENCVCNT